VGDTKRRQDDGSIISLHWAGIQCHIISWRQARWPAK